MTKHMPSPMKPKLFSHMRPSSLFTKRFGLFFLGVLDVGSIFCRNALLFFLLDPNLFCLRFSCLLLLYTFFSVLTWTPQQGNAYYVLPSILTHGLVYTFFGSFLVTTLIISRCHHLLFCWNLQSKHAVQIPHQLEGFGYDVRMKSSYPCVLAILSSLGFTTLDRQTMMDKLGPGEAVTFLESDIT